MHAISRRNLWRYHLMLFVCFKSAMREQELWAMLFSMHMCVPAPEPGLKFVHLPTYSCSPRIQLGRRPHLQ